MDKQRIKVAIAGTGCVGRGLALLLSNLPDFELTGILTRRKGPISDLLVNQALVTNNAHQVMEGTDVLVVSTGDVVYSTEIIRLAFSYKLPVVTMYADTQIVSGSWLAKQGRLTEAEGDQPGCLAALKEEVTAMGFQPLVLGNIKGFLNQNPTMEEMSFWSKKQGFSLHSVTSFTDGTKLQTEQCLVANGLGADILSRGSPANTSTTCKRARFAWLSRPVLPAKSSAITSFLQQPLPGCLLWRNTTRLWPAD